MSIKDPEIESQARQEWLKGLIENGITSDTQINSGLAKARAHNSPFLPSVGQFIEWCKTAAQDVAGLPSESEACKAVMYEVGRPKVARQWHGYHPSVYMAYSMRQSFDWKGYSYKDFRLAFSETWEDVKKLALTGYDFYSSLPSPDEVSAPVTQPPVDREVAAQMSAAILADLGVDAVKTITDNQKSRAALEQAKELLEKRNDL
jgi:hypothetical protein